MTACCLVSSYSIERYTYRHYVYACIYLHLMDGWTYIYIWTHICFMCTYNHLYVIHTIPEGYVIYMDTQYQSSTQDSSTSAPALYPLHHKVSNCSQVTSPAAGPVSMECLQPQKASWHLPAHCQLLLVLPASLNVPQFCNQHSPAFRPSLGSCGAWHM